MASTSLSRTPASAGNRKTWTWSGWVKRGKISANNPSLIGVYSNPTQLFIAFNSSDKLFMQDFGTVFITTSQVFRDPSAWYHIVISFDSTQATSSDRWNLYVNGEQVTSFDTEVYPSQNYDSAFNSTLTHYVGYNNVSSGYYFDGSMSHVHFIDGTAYDASAFGQFDSNGVWTIKTSPSVTYGTNGFFILKDGNSVTDQSGNSNNFTVGGGTLTNTEDCPSNVFATGNPLSPYVNRTISNGNLTLTSTTTHWTNLFSTLGVSTGKWYVELKATAGSFHSFGIVNDFPVSENNVIGDFTSIATQQIGYASNTGTKKVNESTSAYGDTWTNGDIISMALDLDNNYIYFAKNGTWQNSGVPTSGATGTGGISVNSGYTYFIGASAYNSSATSFNFGNGYFGTTAVASAGTNASGIGIFEYDVPTGYTALSTKGLNL